MDLKFELLAAITTIYHALSTYSKLLHVTRVCFPLAAVDKTFLSIKSRLTSLVLSLQNSRRRAGSSEQSLECTVLDKRVVVSWALLSKPHLEQQFTIVPHLIAKPEPVRTVKDDTTDRHIHANKIKVPNKFSSLDVQRAGYGAQAVHS